MMGPEARLELDMSRALSNQHGFIAGAMKQRHFLGRVVTASGDGDELLYCTLTLGLKMDMILGRGRDN